MENVSISGDKVLVLPDETKSISDGGIIIPNSAKEKPIMGTVVSSGPRCESKEGNRVWFGFSSGTELEINKVKYLLMAETDILAIII